MTLAELLDEWGLSMEELGEMLVGDPHGQDLGRTLDVHIRGSRLEVDIEIMSFHRKDYRKRNESV